MYFGYSKYFYGYEHLQNSRNIMINILCHLSSERDVVNAKLRTNVHLDDVDQAGAVALGDSGQGGHKGELKMIQGKSRM